MNITLIFSECEHHGDMDGYISDVVQSGGKIQNQKLDTRDETCQLEISIEDATLFWKKMRETDSFDFIV